MMTMINSCSFFDEFHADLVAEHDLEIIFKLDARIHQIEFSSSKINDLFEIQTSFNCF
jgi:hypothetical protein